CSGTEHQRILHAWPLRKADTVPPLLGALEGVEPPSKFELIDVLQQRGVTTAVPYLWLLYASPDQPPTVRKKATDALVYLLQTKSISQRSAPAELTREAERYYGHQVRFPDPTAVVIWRWD